VANWNLTPAKAEAEVANASGPFPVVAVQYSSGQFYDFDVFDSGWLAAESHAGPPAPFRHLSVKGDTIASLAASRNMRPESFLALQAKLGADVAVLASGPLPAGTVWLSVNP